MDKSLQWWPAESVYGEWSVLLDTSVLMVFACDGIPVLLSLIAVVVPVLRWMAICELGI